MTHRALRVGLDTNLRPITTRYLTGVDHLFSLRYGPRVIGNTLNELNTTQPKLHLPNYISTFRRNIQTVLNRLIDITVTTGLATEITRLCNRQLSSFPRCVYFPAPRQLTTTSPRTLGTLNVPLGQTRTLVRLTGTTLRNALPVAVPNSIRRTVGALRAFPNVKH